MEGSPEGGEVVEGSPERGGGGSIQSITEYMRAVSRASSFMENSTCFIFVNCRIGNLFTRRME